MQYALLGIRSVILRPVQLLELFGHGKFIGILWIFLGDHAVERREIVIADSVLGLVGQYLPVGQPHREIRIRVEHTIGIHFHQPGDIQPVTPCEVLAERIDRIDQRVIGRDAFYRPDR